MPFVKFDAEKEIAKQCVLDPEFKRIHEENESEYKIIGEMICARKQAGLTQTQLAKLTNNQQQAISRMEKRENSPSLRTVCKIFDVLGLELKVSKKQSV